MFRSELIESVYGEAQESALGGCEACASTLYHQLIGSLMYLVNTRPNICFAVNTLSQCMVEPRRVHWVAVKHVLRDLQGTMDYGLDYR